MGGLYTVRKKNPNDTEEIEQISDIFCTGYGIHNGGNFTFSSFALYSMRGCSRTLSSGKLFLVLLLLLLLHIFYLWISLVQKWEEDSQCALLRRRKGGIFNLLLSASTGRL